VCAHVRRRISVLFPQLEDKARRKEEQRAQQRRLDADMESARVTALQLREVRQSAAKCSEAIASGLGLFGQPVEALPTFRTASGGRQDHSGTGTMMQM